MNEKIENLLKEERKFPPSAELIKNANATSSWYDDADKEQANVPPAVCRSR